jgi:hypothetical protein
MPYRDSEYPSILRGRDKRESQRLMAAAPEMLNALRGAAKRWDKEDEADDPVLGAVIRSAIASAEGRE